MEKLFQLFLFYPLLLFCLSFHESAHAWAANKFGDDTAKLLGRISLNPMRHIDFIGTVFLPILSILTGAALIGWGKPVPVNPNRFRNPRKDSLWVAAAGPASNFLLAALFAIVFRLILNSLTHMEPVHLEDGKIVGDAMSVLLSLCHMGVFLNLVLAFFNLIPLFPLDGGTVLRGLLPHRFVFYYDQMTSFGILVLLILFVLGLLRYLLIPVNLAAQFLLP